MSKVPKPHESHESHESSRSVVEAVHGLESPYCMVQIQREDEDSKKVSGIAHHFGTYAEHTERLSDDHDDESEWYMTIAQTRDESTKVTNVTQSWGVVVDLDSGLPAVCKRGKQLEPTLLIETSQDRFHAIYVVDKPMVPHEMGRLAKAMAARLGGDMAMARVNQMVRLPGRVNQKHGGMVTLREDIGTHNAFAYAYLWRAVDGALYEAHVKADLPQLNHTTQSPLRDTPAMLTKHVKQAVEYLATKGFADDYDTWFKTIVNLTPLGVEGYQTALDFSKGSDKFDHAAFDKKWASCMAANTGALSTLFAMAQREGWKNPGWAGSDDAVSVSPPSERDFGLAVAREMAGNFAAIDPPEGSKAKGVIFLRSEETACTTLNPRQKRSAIAEAAAAVISRTCQGGNEQAMVGMKKKLGSNRQLEELADHVAEALVPMSEARVVGGYPHLPVANGVVNVLTGELVPYRYQPIPKQACRVVFDPSAQAKRFKLFMMEVLEGDKEMIRFVMRVLGYALLGRPVEQVMFVFLGPSENGKSTLLEVMLKILGPFATRLRTEALMQKSHVMEGASPALANLSGKRLVIVAEPNANHKLDSSLVKQLTGESSMQVRGLFSDVQDMAIECCFFMTANYMPFATADDKGLWRRIRIIPFERVFKAEEINKNLKDELFTESSGILNLLLEGLADYLKQGLNPPPKVTETVKARREEADSYVMFMHDCCEQMPMERTALKDLWTAYLEWAKANSKFRTMVKSELQSRLEAEYERKIVGNNPHLMGIRLTKDAD